MSTVYVVQRPAYFDTIKKGWVNKYDISSAREYGDLVFLLPPGNIYKNKLTDTIKGLHKVLENFSPEDHILAIGDPVAIAATVMVAAKKSTKGVSLLKWDRLAGKYEAYTIELAPNDG